MSFFEFPHTRTYDSDLGWLIKHVNSYDETINALNAWITENQPKMDDVYAFVDAMNNGQLPAGVKQGLFEWASENLVDLVGATIKAVFFGITDDGHFVAYIPDSWSDIVFNTTYYDIVLTSHPEYGYGHLVLSY